MYESISRIVNGTEAVKPWFMFGTAVFGLVCNLSMMKVLHGSGHGHDHGDGHGHSHGGDKKEDHGHAHGDDKGEAHGHDHGHSHGPKHGEEGHVHKDDEEDHHSHDEKAQHDHDHAHAFKAPEVSSGDANENANIRAAMVHVIGDIIQSVGVILASVLILIWPEASIVDPICTLVFAILVLFTTVKIFRTYFRILMEGTPDNINYFELKSKILAMFDEIEEVCDLHIWSITQGKMAATCHIKLSDDVNAQLILLAVTLYLRSNGIYHTTIQIQCPTALEGHVALDCAQDIHGTIENTKTELAKLDKIRENKQAGYNSIELIKDNMQFTGIPTSSNIK